METIFMNTKNSKMNEANKLVTKIRLDFRILNKYVTLQNLSIYYTWKNIRQQYKNNKLKIIPPTWIDEFELPNGSYSVSGIQYYIEHIIKKHKTSYSYPLIIRFIFISIGSIIA